MPVSKERTEVLSKEEKDAAVVGIRRVLREKANEETRRQGQRFFKEDEAVSAYGLWGSDVTKIAKEHFRPLKARPKEEIFRLCDVLWRSGYLEETLVACAWAYALRAQYQSDDFTVFASWVERYVDNWASCDTLCNHTIGTFVEMYPAFVGRLRAWTASENRWAKRAAAVSLIVPARKGLFRDDIFAIAEAFLEERDDMVQKGYGWMLKAASQAEWEDVFAFLMRHRARMGRTAFRYALEKMPPEKRAEAMGK